MSKTMPKCIRESHVPGRIPTRSSGKTGSRRLRLGLLMPIQILPK
jgi:hypothetical protein